MIHKKFKKVIPLSLLIFIILFSSFFTNVNKIDAGGSNIATISSSVYLISTEGGGNETISNIPEGTSQSDFLNNLTKDEENQIWNTDRLQDPVQTNDYIIVTASDGVTQITYTLIITPNSNVATISSSLYTISNTGLDYETITNVPVNTSKSNFLSALNKDEPNQTWDSIGINDPVQYGDEIKVTAQDNVTQKIYIVDIIDESNTVPAANLVSISGSSIVGNTLQGNYTYNDSDINWVNVGNQNFSDGQIGLPKIKIGKNGVIFVAYKDVPNNSKISVLKYDPNISNPTWTPVGELGFSLYAPIDLDLSIDQNNIPFIGYLHGSNNYKPIVMKYDTSLPTPAWVNVGEPDFSINGVGQSISMEVNSEGIPYVFFLNLLPGPGSHNSAKVMKYDTSLSTPAWVNVGNENFSADNIGGGMDLALDKDDTPYVGFEDFNEPTWTPSRATVMKYDPSSNTWVYVGGRGAVSPDEIGYFLITFDKNTNTPYVLYQNWESPLIEKKIVVTKYDSSLSTPAWVNVGEPDFSIGAIYSPSITVNEDGVVYVAYLDMGNNKMTVKKYDNREQSPSWENLKPFGFGEINGGLTITSYRDKPYLFFADLTNNGKAKVLELNTNGDPEGTSIFKWYRNDVEIPGETTSTYITKSIDIGKIIKFEVTPVALSGELVGTSVKSSGVLIEKGLSSGGSYGSSILKVKKIEPLPGLNNLTSFTRVLKLKKPQMRGDDVKSLQIYLNSHNFALPVNLVTDGVFGKKTKIAVINLQKTHKLIPDGIVGPLTQALIK